MRVCFTFNFKGQKSKKKNILAYDHRRWNRCIISKRRKPIITWCGVVVPQKNWKVSYGDYLGHKCGCFSVGAFGQKCLTACTLQQPCVIQPSEVNFRVCKSVHHYTFNWINQPDAGTSQLYYLSFKYSSTCLGHPHAYHQELQQLHFMFLYRALWYNYEMLTNKMHIFKLVF